MKKVNSFFSHIVIVFVCFGILSGCTKEYQSERYLYKATKLATRIIAAPEAVPPSEFNKVMEIFQYIFKNYSDLPAAKRALAAQGGLYMARKEYEKAREEFRKILEVYPDNQAMILEAQFGIGKSYEKEENWSKALEAYRGIIKEYPKTPLALNMPIYIIQHYEKEKDFQGADNAYSEALEYYKSISKEYPGTKIGFNAMNFTAGLYLKRQNWPMALETLTNLAMDYPMVQTTGLVMRMMGSICVARLKSPEKAIEIYQKFLEKYPKHPLVPAIKKGMEALKNVPAGN